MDVPQIQFATASDGVRIAYWTLGTGDPLIYVGVPCFSHAQLEVHLPLFMNWYGKLASRRRLIRVDLRGYGASQREGCEISAEGFQRDVLAVAGALGLPRFALFTQGGASTVALELAANSDVVDRLVICDGWADGTNHPIHRRIAATESLADLDWRMFSELMAGFFMGVGDNRVKETAWFIRQCVDAGPWRAFLALMQRTDVSPLLPRVTCPTLLLHTGASPLTGQGDPVRAVASSITGARLVSLDAPQFPLGDTAAVYDLVDTFLGPAEIVGPMFDAGVLSPREREVLELVTLGRTNREIAEHLVISSATADRHVHNILTKLGVANRTEATGWAASHFQKKN